MCVALEADRGEFVKQENATTVGGVSSDQEKDRIRASARKLALPLALSAIPYGPFRSTKEGWERIDDGWGPPLVGRLCDVMPESNCHELWIGGWSEGEVPSCCRGSIDGSVGAEPSGR